MPSEVPVETAVWQMGRVVAVTNALATGNAGLLSTACVDKLHEPYRKKLIPDYDALREAARMARASAFVISGSGAAMIAICESPTVAQAVTTSGYKSLSHRLQELQLPATTIPFTTTLLTRYKKTLTYTSSKSFCVCEFLKQPYFSGLNALQQPHLNVVAYPPR